MTITLGSTTLCSGDTRATDGSPAGPDGLTGTLEPGVLDREYIGAAGVEPEAVGCDRSRVSFGVTRTYGSAASALAYISGAFLSEDAEGQLKFGDSVIMTNAVVRSRSFSLAGCTVAVRYQIEGY